MDRITESSFSNDKIVKNKSVDKNKYIQIHLTPKPVVPVKILKIKPNFDWAGTETVISSKGFTVNSDGLWTTAVSDVKLEGKMCFKISTSAK